MQLDRVDVSFDGIVEAGQAYVALSRARTLDGLHLADLAPHRIRAHPAALRFYADAGVPADPDAPPPPPPTAAAAPPPDVAPAVVACLRAALPPRHRAALGLAPADADADTPH